MEVLRILIFVVIGIVILILLFLIVLQTLKLIRDIKKRIAEKKKSKSDDKSNVTKGE